MGEGMKSIGIVFIGTSKYRKFFDGYYEGIINNFLKSCEKKFFVFTDNTEDVIFDKKGLIKTKIEHEGWPWITLNRFKYMLLAKEELTKCDYIFFIDADLWCVSEVTEEEILESSLVGVQHPGFLGRIGTFETDTRSKSNIFDGKYDLKKYRQGCLWGGKSGDVIEMVEKLDQWVKEDLQNGIVAVWHDESHTNKYFLLNPQIVKTLHPGFAQPQNGYDNIRKNFPTKFVHLHKDMGEFPRFSGVK